MSRKLAAARKTIHFQPLRRAVRAALTPSGRRCAGLVAGLVCVAPAAFGDAFPPTVDLATLDGADGFVIDGAANASLGSSISDAGDVNGDGFADLSIGAEGDYSAAAPGTHYVVLGGPSVGSDGSFDVATIDGSNGFTIFNDAEPREFAALYEGFGNGRAAGDMNGDGFDDVVAIARSSDRYTGYAGAAHVMFGRAGDFPASTANWTLAPPEGFISTPGSVDGDVIDDARRAGDVNGDGFDDLIVGSPIQVDNPSAGGAYLVFGGPNVSGGDGAFVVNGLGEGDGAGAAVAGGGDVNGDGLADFVIAAPNAPNGAGDGLAYVVFGNASFGPNDSFDLATLDGSNGFVLDGRDVGGGPISIDGDVNGDGLDDIVVGDPAATVERISSGAAYVVFGRSQGWPATFSVRNLDGGNGYLIAGVAADDGTGTSVDIAPDVNGDGVDDIVIGAPRLETGEPGLAYVVFGGADVGASGRFALSSLNGANGFTLEGVAADDAAGSSVSGAGDVNGDGVADVLVAAPDALAGSPRPGAGYVVFGRRLDGAAPSCTVTATPSTLTPPNHQLVSVTTSVTVKNSGAGFELVSVTSNEPGMGLPGGDVKWDIQNWDRGTADTSGELRAELDPNGGGRVYTFVYRVTGTTAASATCETTVNVPPVIEDLHITIDIAPSDPNNVVRPTSDDIVRVALLSSASLPFDPLQVNPDSLRFGPRNARSLYEFTRDVNRDGVPDVVATFSVPATGITCGAIRATLVGQTYAGQRVYDSDRIITAGCP